MARKIIYLSWVKWTQHTAEFFFIDYCIEHGALVEYWDIVALMADQDIEKSEIDPGYLRYISTLEEFDKLLQQPQYQNAIFVTDIACSARSSKFFRLLSKYNCKMISFGWGRMPTSVSSTPFWRRAIRRFLVEPINSMSLAIGLLVVPAYRAIKAISRFEIVFTAGEVTPLDSVYAKKVVSLNWRDFDCYKKVKLLNNKIVKGRYAVFLDQNFCHHPDARISNYGQSALNENLYKQSLNRFFSLTEEAYGIKVVIAAHPTSSNEKFEQREVYRMATADLVKNAEFVIMHSSTALSFAILNLKPILFIYTDEIKEFCELTIFSQIERIALFLGEDIYNVNQITNGSQIIVGSPCIENYESYKYTYLTSRESEEFFSAEIFWRELSTLL